MLISQHVKNNERQQFHDYCIVLVQAELFYKKVQFIADVTFRRGKFTYSWYVKVTRTLDTVCFNELMT